MNSLKCAVHISTLLLAFIHRAVCVYAYVASFRVFPFLARLSAAYGY